MFKMLIAIILIGFNANRAATNTVEIYYRSIVVSWSILKSQFAYRGVYTHQDINVVTYDYKCIIKI